MAKSKKLIIDYNKLRSLVRLNCPDSVILKAILLEQQSIGDELVDDLLGSFVIYKEFDNWGGSRIGSGRKSKPNQDDFQVENQDDKIKMIKSRCNQDVDKDNNIDNNKNKIIDIYTRFNAGFQNWKFEPALLTVAKKHWTADTIRKIEIDFSCQEYNTETSIQELLERYPADVSKGFKKPTLDEVKAYCRERNNSVDPEKFYNYYESNGWKVGKNPMKNWKSAVITWEKSGYNTQKKPNINLDACEDNFLDDTPYWLKNYKD